MKKLFLLVMLLFAGQMVGAQIFYVPVRIKENLSIGMGSAVKASDSTHLEIGKRADTSKRVVRLSPPVTDTGRAYKIEAGIIYNRGDKAYYYWNGTLWKKMGS